MPMGENPDAEFQREVEEASTFVVCLKYLFQAELLELFCSQARLLSDAIRYGSPDVPLPEGAVVVTIGYPPEVCHFRNGKPLLILVPMYHAVESQPALPNVRGSFIETEFAPVAPVAVPIPTPVDPAESVFQKQLLSVALLAPANPPTVLLPLTLPVP